jgi:Mor family transcriptional regulator
VKCDSQEVERLLSSIEYGSEIVELGKVIGIDSLRVVLSMLGGPLDMQVYIPSFDNFIAALRRQLRNNDIHDSYNGTPASIGTLAARYGISNTRVRQIVAQGREG